MAEHERFSFDSSAQLMLSEGNVGHFRELVVLTRDNARRTIGPYHDLVLVLQLTHSGR